MPDSVHNQAQKRQSPQPNRLDSTEVAGESAIPHVGPTLESDPELNGIGSKGYDTPEAAIAGEAAGGDVDTRAVSEEGFDPVTGRRTQAPRTGRPPERLITHLAGDTSSEPHTDVGPDNAATVKEGDDRQPR